MAYGFGRGWLRQPPRQNVLLWRPSSGQHIVRFPTVVSYAEIIPGKVETRL